MLTFEFTGVEGRMTGSEILTSGMVGKTVQILFDDSWTNLTKTLVIKHAGSESQFYLEDQLITKRVPDTYLPIFPSVPPVLPHPAHWWNPLPSERGLNRCMFIPDQAS